MNKPDETGHLLTLDMQRIEVTVENVDKITAKGVFETTIKYFNYNWKLDQSNITMHELGETAAIGVIGDCTADGLVWKSSDESVVTVKNGIITAVGQGAAKVYAYANDFGARIMKDDIKVVL